MLKAFSISWLILTNASRTSSDGVAELAPEAAVLVPHFGQKRESSGSLFPQLEQYATALSPKKVKKPKI